MSGARALAGLRHGYYTAASFARMGRLVAELGPTRFLDLYRRWTWLKTFLQMHRILGDLTGKRTGAMQRGTAAYLGAFVDQVSRSVADGLMRVLAT